MRILLIGATGTIGAAIAALMSARHDVVLASRSSPHNPVDIAQPDAIKALYARVGTVDAVIVAAGQPPFKPLTKLTDEDFAHTLREKLMGQVNVVRYGFGSVSDGGSFTLTSGSLAQLATPGSAAASLVNAGLEGFARAAAIDAPRKIRVNVVSLGWVTETLVALKMDPRSGVPAATLAQVYARAVEGKMNGQVLTP